MVCLQGGGAYLFPYIIMLILFVYPALAIETSVAQFFRRPVPEIMAEYSPKWIGIVYLEIYVLVVVATYYVYIMAYAVLYIFHGIFGRLAYLTASKETMLLEVQKHFNNEILKNSYNPKTDVC